MERSGCRWSLATDEGCSDGGSSGHVWSGGGPTWTRGDVVVGRGAAEAVGDGGMGCGGWRRGGTGEAGIVYGGSGQTVGRVVCGEGEEAEGVGE